MIACINYFLGLNQHQSGGLGQMVEIVIIWPAFRSLNVAHGFISDIIDGSQLKYPSWSTEIVRFFFLRCRVSFTVFAHTCTLWKAELAAAHRFLCLPWRIQPASRSRAELHCLSDNAWLTWSTSEPDILLSLHHNATTQTDMAALLISRAGFTDLLCAHCDATWFL